MDEDHIRKIKDSLDQYHDWPCVYIFKFIMPTVPNKRDELMRLFSEDIEISSRVSKNAKYTSITIKEVILNSDEVLKRYSDVNEIEGVMAL